MHIPDNYLSPATCAVAALMVAPVWALSIKKVQAELTKEKIPLLGIGAAFAFLIMMFNVPLPGGTSAHAIGGTLIAILLGPWAACLAVSVALLIQALLFADGGILAYGANCLNMAVILPFVGYFFYKLIADHIQGNRGRIIGAAVGSYVGVNLAALFAAIEFGLQPLLFKGPDGLPLYCPYPLSISVPAMVIPHLIVVGAVEIIFTVSVLVFLKKVSPELFQQTKQTKSGILYGIIVFLICIVPLGLLAGGSAWGEWGAKELANNATNGLTPLGYIPAGMKKGFSFEAIFQDYNIPGLGEVPGYILSAIAGVAVLIIVFKILGSVLKKRTEG